MFRSLGAVTLTWVDEGLLVGIRRRGAGLFDPADASAHSIGGGLLLVRGRNGGDGRTVAVGRAGLSGGRNGAV